jgi:hypothetical protein
MANKFMRYGFGAIGLYLVLYWGTNAGTVISAGAKGVSQDVQAFQGR